MFYIQFKDCLTGLYIKIIASLQLEAGASAMFRREVVWDGIDPESGYTVVTMSRWVTSVTYTDGDGITLYLASLAVPYINMLESEFARRRHGNVVVEGEQGVCPSAFALCLNNI